MSASGDYGRLGTVGIGVPQANPTVEAEMAILLPPGIARVTARLTSAAPTAEARLTDYIERLDETLATFDTLRPAVFGFACTASTYLVGAEREAAITAAAQRRLGYAVVTAAAALLRHLRAIGARRIALVSPYPAALGDAARRFWRGQGLDIVETASVPLAGDDTRGIYALSSDDARRALAAIGAQSADAVLVTGTGMPSLPLIAAPPPGLPPIVSSNLALAEALLAVLDVEPSDWRRRLSDVTGEPA